MEIRRGGERRVVEGAEVGMGLAAVVAVVVVEEADRLQE